MLNKFMNTKYICMIINYKIYEKQKSIDFYLNNNIYVPCYFCDGWSW